ncbi:hypothetical protein SAMN05421823_109184 [Catalinimonas alkaloidigena]|uniref:Por secretion system C-terminal sorting domain-containing protein n=1 Tax=Catalinimonas alkaloidigena TaxID=1075417 RepID=A0A1G9PG40_9BACT|nr:hypothetical protein [Catalinimonas alkaloidigena]SDL97740.1 hypothetical protein SAMN05421823_109184 [Catalinimonas alkaloidigena]
MLKQVFYVLILIALGARFGSTGYAQDVSYYEKQHVSAHSGFWQVLTDPDNRTTTIRFYDEHRQVVYQEELVGKYVRLTARNRRKLDGMLEQVLHNRLVAATVGVTEMQKLARGALLKMPDVLLRDESKVEKQLALQRAQIRLNAYMMPQSLRMKVLIDNPKEERMKIRLMDTEGATLYEENTSAVSYHRPFDLQGMPVGTYTLLVKSRKQSFVRELEVKPADKPLAVMSDVVLP